MCGASADPVTDFVGDFFKTQGTVDDFRLFFRKRYHAAGSK